MKLRDTNDKYSLLTEVNRLDLLDADEIPDSVFELFIKRRRQRVNRLKDFRKSQSTKAAWRKSRWSYMKGIHKFQRSIKAKRLHRSMGRFLALRNFPVKRPARESLEIVKDLVLKANSSIRTHLYIEQGYYMPLRDQVEFELLAEYILPILRHVETSLYEDVEYELSDEELECILRIVRVNEILKALAEVSGSSLDMVRGFWKETEDKEKEGDSTYLTKRFRETVEQLRKGNS